jgi:hypothetical protein
MPMLPENEKKFDHRIRIVKLLLDDALDYFRKGNYDAALRFLTQVGSEEIYYLTYIVEEDRADRIAKDFLDWSDEKFKSLVDRSIQFRK